MFKSNGISGNVCNEQSLQSLYTEAISLYSQKWKAQRQQSLVSAIQLEINNTRKSSYNNIKTKANSNQNSIRVEKMNYIHNKEKQN